MGGGDWSGEESWTVSPTIPVHLFEGPGSLGHPRSSRPVLPEEQVAWCLGHVLRALTSLLHPLPPVLG